MLYFYELLSVGCGCEGSFAFDINMSVSRHVEAVNSQETWYNIPVFLVLLVAAVAIAYFVSKSIVNVRKKKELELAHIAYEKQLFLIKQKALQVQMNPHMLFNALNSIQLFVLKGEADNALKYLAKFSQFIRRVLSNSSKNYVTLAEELDLIKLYLEIEDLRFDERFDFDIETASEIDAKLIEIPSMIIQPYIDNAIEHGLLHKKEKGKLNIKFEKYQNNLLCIIQDNGVGRQKASEIREESGIVRKSNGIQLTKEQLDIMNCYVQGQYTVHVIDLYDNQNEACGTRVEIQINIKTINNDSVHNR